MNFKCKTAIASIVMIICFISVFLGYSLSTHAPSIERIDEWAIIIFVTLGNYFVLAVLYALISSFLLVIKFKKQDQSTTEEAINRYRSEIKNDEMAKRVSAQASRRTSVILYVTLIACLVLLICKVEPTIVLLVAFAGIAAFRMAKSIYLIAVMRSLKGDE